MRIAIVMAAVAILACGMIFRWETQHARAAGANTAVLLASESFGFAFSEGPCQEPPTAVHIAYGFFSQQQEQPILVVFDDLLIVPSDQTQAFFVNVASDAGARALVNAIREPVPVNTIFGIGSWFDGSNGRGVGGSEPLEVSRNDRIDSFKLIVPPFSIDLHEGDFPSCSFDPLTNTSAIVEAYGLSDAGDANCDTISDSLDALIMLQLEAGLLDSLPCPKAADANGDGAVDSLDASLILQFAAGLIAQP